MTIKFETEKGACEVEICISTDYDQLSFSWITASIDGVYIRAAEMSDKDYFYIMRLVHRNVDLYQLYKEYRDDSDLEYRLGLR